MAEERLTVISTTGRIPDTVLTEVADLLESRWPEGYACNITTADALFRALAKERGLRERWGLIDAEGYFAPRERAVAEEEEHRMAGGTWRTVRIYVPQTEEGEHG